MCLLSIGNRVGAVMSALNRNLSPDRITIVIFQRLEGARRGLWTAGGSTRRRNDGCLLLRARWLGGCCIGTEELGIGKE